MQKKDKLVIVCLFASLALNMFLGGVLLGRHYESPYHRFERALHKKDDLIKQSLSDADRDVLKGVMSAHKVQLDQLRNDLKTLRKDIADAGRHNDFDADVLQKKMEEENQKRFEVLSLMHEMRQKVYADISDEGRDVLMKIGIEPRKFHSKKRASHKMGDEEPDYLPFIWEEGMF